MKYKNVKHLIVTPLSICVLLLGCQSSKAQIAAVQSISYSSFDQQASTADATYGWKFTVGSVALSVTHLGLLDLDAPGFVDSHRIGIWDSSDHLVADVSIASGNSGTLNNGFLYYQLSSPVTLQAGQSYSIGNWSAGSSDRIVQSLAGATYATDYLTYSGASYALPGSVGTGFAAPNHNFSASHGVFGPNLEFAPVPEPAEYASIGGLALIGFAIYRRAKTASA